MMVLIDTSVWINHLSKADSIVEKLLREDRVVTHSFVFGELALGSTRAFGDTRDFFKEYDRVPMATTKEVFELIEEQKLNGKGVGLVDIYLLAGCLIDGRTKLLTADKRLAKAAEDLGINFSAS